MPRRVSSAGASDRAGGRRQIALLFFLGQSEGDVEHRVVYRCCSDPTPHTLSYDHLRFAVLARLTQRQRAGKTPSAVDRARALRARCFLERVCIFPLRLPPENVASRAPADVQCAHRVERRLACEYGDGYEDWVSDFAPCTAVPDHPSTHEAKEAISHQNCLFRHRQPCRTGFFGPGGASIPVILGAPATASSEGARRSHIQRRQGYHP